MKLVEAARETKSFKIIWNPVWELLKTIWMLGDVKKEKLMETVGNHTENEPKESQIKRIGVCIKHDRDLHCS